MANQTPVEFYSKAKVDTLLAGKVDKGSDGTVVVNSSSSVALKVKNGDEGATVTIGCDNIQLNGEDSSEYVQLMPDGTINRGTEEDDFAISLPSGSGTLALDGDKLDCASAAAAFSASTAYAVGSYVTYGGRVYKCTTAHPAGAWNAAHFTESPLMDADASLVIDDVTDELKVVDAGGNVVWTSSKANRYAMNRTSSTSPAADSVQYLELSGDATITLPTVQSGRVMDFVLDVHATAESLVTISNEADITIFVTKGKTRDGVLTFADGDYARLSFTSAAFATAAYHIERVDLHDTTEDDEAVTTEVTE